MAFVLESHALAHSSFDATIDLEKNLMYWINYDRMTYIYKTKGDFFLDKNNEASWQIEYWEAFLKHGAQISESKIGTPDIWYSDFHIYRSSTPFMPEARPVPDASLIPIPDLVARLKKGFSSDAEADGYIRDYLDRWFGKPLVEAKWLGEALPVEGVPAKLLGNEFPVDGSVDSMILVKPIDKGTIGWAPYLYNRYWAYFYDSSKVLDLVRMSLDHGWPVTFDMGAHAETIIGYREAPVGTMYAIADSLASSIAWVDSGSMQSRLNLVTFFKDAIPGAIPPRLPRTMARELLSQPKPLSPPR
jgi:hypothetical protein